MAKPQYSGHLRSVSRPNQHAGSNRSNVFVIDASGQALARDETLLTDERPKIRKQTVRGRYGGGHDSTLRPGHGGSALGERFVNLLGDPHGCLQRHQTRFATDYGRLSRTHAIQKRLDLRLEGIALLQ